MVTLRVVGASHDNAQLLLSDKPKGTRGTHSILIDKRLLSVLQAAVYARRDAVRRDEDQDEEQEERYISRSQPTAVEPPRVAPREIQRMLRSGLSPKQVAKTTETDLDYVERFYQPIIYERGGVVADAQSLFIEKSRLGLSGLPLGEAVDQNLLARRVRLDEQELSDAWSATREEGGPWIVTLTFPFRGRKVRAAWRFDARERLLEPMNRAALDLGWVSPARKTTARKTTARKPARKTTARKPARKTTARKPARKTTARKPARKTTARKPARKTTARKPARKTTARKPAARKPARKTTARKPAARKPARKTTARKPAARKPARKTTTRKPARKTTARKPAARKPARRRAPARRR